MLKRFHAVLVNIDMYPKITIIDKYRFDTLTTSVDFICISCIYFKIKRWGV